MKTLDKLEIGQSAVIKAVNGEGSRRQHFLDMGVIPDAVIKLVKYAPLGDPMEVMIHGYSLTLRKADATMIEVEPENEMEPKVPSIPIDFTLARFMTITLTQA